MTCVDRVKELCKERKIPISRLERELDFGNAYISRLKKGTFPADRLDKIAKYFEVSPEYLMYGEKEQPHVPEDIGPNKQKILNSVPDLTEAEAALLLDRIEKIKESRV